MACSFQSALAIQTLVVKQKVRATLKWMLMRMLGLWLLRKHKMLGVEHKRKRSETAYRDEALRLAAHLELGPTRMEMQVAVL